MCRASTNFITPSSKFWKAGTKEKDETIKAYRESMSRVPCRYVYSVFLANYILLMESSLVGSKGRCRKIKTNFFVLMEKIVSINT